MDFYKEIACLEISSNVKELTELGDLIWNLAETGYETQKSSEAVCKLLEKHSFKVTRNLKGIKSTFLAEYGRAKVGTKKYTSVAILCRYDAVPDRGHTKGTNLAAEAAVAAAIGLKAVISSTADRLGKVSVFGCPNQEGGGLIPLMRLRAFQGLDIVLTAAPGSRTEWHPRYLGCTNLRALYYGADADSEKMKPGSDALDASIMAYTKVLAMQEHFGRGWKTAGSIAQPGSITVDRQLCQTTVKMTAPSNVDLRYMKLRIMPCLQAAAVAAGCEVSFSQGVYTIHSLIGNIQLAYLLQLNGYHCGVLSTPRRPGDIPTPPVDVAEVSLALPTVRPVYYIGTDARPGTDEFKEAARTSAAHQFTLAMGKALAMTALDVMHTPGTLAVVKEDLKRSLELESKAKFTPFSRGAAPVVDKQLIKTEMPSDTGAVGWAK